jgi:FAD binding domain
MEATEPAGRAADVVIVGAGPVGLMLACELGRAGIRPLVLERAAQPSAMPKGNGLVGDIVTVLKQRGLLSGQKGRRAVPVPRYFFGTLPLRLNPVRASPCACCRYRSGAWRSCWSAGHSSSARRSAAGTPPADSAMTAAR